MPARPTLGILLVLLVVGVLVHEELDGTFEKVERQWIAWLLANSPGAITDPEVTFVQIDDTEDRIFESWPLSPGDYSLLFQNLGTFNPRLVGIAPSLRWEQPGMLYDSLIRGLEAIPESVLGTELGFLEAENEFVDPALAALFDPIKDVIGDRKKVPAFTTVLDLPQDEVRAGRALGFTRLGSWQDEHPSRADGGVRVPLLARYGEQIIPGFALRLSMAHFGVSADAVRVSLGRWIRFADREIPIDLTGAMVVDPGLRLVVPRVNASALLLGADLESLALDAEETRALRSMQSNAVVIGVDEPGSRTIAFSDTGEPDGIGLISPADLLVTAVATIQGRRHVRELEIAGRVVLWVLLVAAAAALFLVSPGRSVGLGLLLVLGFGTVALLLFQGFKIWVSPVVPLGSLLFAMVAAGVTAAESPVSPGEEQGGE
jgi:CHASE2 domain-containing sensor protein